MNSAVLIKSFDTLPFCEKEIFRYAGVQSADGALNGLLQNCLDETSGMLSYQVCYRILPLRVDGTLCDFGSFSLISKDLVHHLDGCEKAVIFAATLGVGIDRLITRYSHVSPSKAVMFQAIGTEQIEALCDLFCTSLSAEHGVNLTSRFSPGYGDLPIDAQKDLFANLECSTKIGLALTDSFIMSPSKSVTAIAGFSSEKCDAQNKCKFCQMKNCTLRGKE